MKWTASQQNAIDIPVSDIIVSAAAGSGKTAVMAERIIKRLTGEKAVDIDKILVVTYTNAAASEIKERVMKKILEKMDTSNDETLQRQLILLNNAHFCTIHSFCLELIKKYFYILGINPDVKTGDEADLTLLLTEAASSVISEYLMENDEAFKLLLTAYSKGKEKNLQETIINFYKFARTMPDSNRWLDDAAKCYNENSHLIEEYIADCTFLALDYVRSEYKRAQNLIISTGTCEKWLPNINTELKMVEAALGADKNYKSCYSLVSAISFDKLPTSKDEDAKIKKEIYDCREAAKKAIKLLKEKFFALTPEYIKKDNENVYTVVKKLTEAVKRTGDKYSLLKREKNIIDFSDYEHMVLSLLRTNDGSPSDISYAVSSMFEEIYVDEFQDCNNIQNEIFKLISGGIYGRPNLFCVGDMKQSIYKFRDANPLNFREKCDSFPEYKGGDVKENNKILLNSNFRSRATVLDYVNTVFSQIMTTDCGDVNYTADEALYLGGSFEEINPDTSYIDIDIINESNDFGDNILPDNPDTLSSHEAEACHIASKIKSMVDREYLLYDAKTQTSSKASYKDFVILLRSPRSLSHIYEEAFAKQGIPLYCDNSGGYFETEEIDFLVNLLKIIDNPDDDIALASVMKHPVFSFDENLLIKIRLGGGKGTFYQSVVNYLSNEKGKTKDKLNSFMSRLDDYNLKSRYMKTDVFLNYLISDIDYFVYLSTLDDSKTRKENVRFLIEKARQFEESNFKGIFSFIRYVENTKSSGDECAKIIGENDNVVHLMSIHKSKGLEFPIVILAGMGKQYNLMDARSSEVIHKDFGIGLDCIYPEKAYKIPTLNKIAIKNKLKYDIISEELRVLYVALTRPKEKLIITGSVKRGSSFLNSLERILKTQEYNINPYIIANSRTYLETILLSSMRSENFETSSFENGGVVVSDGIKYNINTINLCDISFNEDTLQAHKWEESYAGITDEFDNMSEFLTYSYPYLSSGFIPGNVTVTEIKKMKTEDDESHVFFDDINLKKPSNFASVKSIYGSALGTLIHLCMEKLDLTRISKKEDIVSQLTSLAADGIITEDELNSIDTERILRFANSSVGKRIAENYKNVKKEFSFKYMTDASDIFEIETNEKIIVQGTIDLFFEDADGEIVILDYKTDKVSPRGKEAIAERYRVQLDCYAKALETMLGKRVKEKLIYLFDTDEVVSV